MIQNYYFALRKARCMNNVEMMPRNHLPRNCARSSCAMVVLCDMDCSLGE